MLTCRLLASVDPSSLQDSQLLPRQSAWIMSSVAVLVETTTTRSVLSRMLRSRASRQASFPASEEMSG